VFAHAVYYKPHVRATVGDGADRDRREREDERKEDDRQGATGGAFGHRGVEDARAAGAVGKWTLIRHNR
jgi:hypothetical protein